MAAPRGKKQMEVWGISKALPKLTEAKVKEIEGMYVAAFLTRPSKKRQSEGWCSKCGGSFNAHELYHSGKGKSVCPLCGANISEIIRDTKKQHYNDSWYVHDLKVVKGYQVIRGYQCFGYSRKGMERNVFKDEVFRIFLVPGMNRTYYLSKDVNGLMSRCFDNYRTGSEITFKNGSERFYVWGAVLSRPQIHPFLRKRGLNSKIIQWLEGISLNSLKKIEHSGITETVLKIGDKAMVNTVFSNRFYTFEKYWPSIRIALRHKYKIADWKTYLDFLDHVERAHRDLRNPHYICPANLREEEMKYIEAERRERLRREAEREERARISRIERDKQMNDLNSKMNRTYREKVKKFLSMSFISGNVRIYTLQSVKEFFQFGEALHHCVYSNGYYKKDGCLILGATVNDEIMECIEIDIRTNTIVQCRGKHNQDSPHHKQILSLAQKSLPQLRIAK